MTARARAAEEVAAKRARLKSGLAAVAEWEAEHGAFTAPERAAVDRELAELGVLPAGGGALRGRWHG